VIKEIVEEGMVERDLRKINGETAIRSLEVIKEGLTLRVPK